MWVCVRVRLFASAVVRFPQAPTPFPESSKSISFITKTINQ
jgi:hypothetical protein